MGFKNDFSRVGFLTWELCAHPRQSYRRNSWPREQSRLPPHSFSPEPGPRLSDKILECRSPSAPKSALEVSYALSCPVPWVITVPRNNPEIVIEILRNVNFWWLSFQSWSAVWQQFCEDQRVPAGEGTGERIEFWGYEKVNPPIIEMLKSLITVQTTSAL